MVKGFNSDIIVRGVSFHVQTEDWGLKNPFIVSRVFKGGAVYRTIKTSYEDSVDIGPVAHPQNVVAAVKNQHTQIIDLLLGGQL